MYRFKKEFKDKLLGENTIAEVANTIGITPKWLGDILAERAECSKVLALIITKLIDEDKEIEDYFSRKEVI